MLDGNCSEPRAQRQAVEPRAVEQLAFAVPPFHGRLGGGDLRRFVIREVHFSSSVVSE